jgi:hypothetical protein
MQASLENRRRVVVESPKNVFKGRTELKKVELQDQELKRNMRA